MLRLEFIKDVSKSASFSARFDFARSDFKTYKPSESGTAISARGRYRFGDWLTLSAKYSVYSTDGYESALWIFDGTVQGMLRTVALYGDGTYFAIDAKYDPVARLTLSAKFFINSKFNQSTIGTGNDEIQSGTDRGLIFQLDWKL
jgi:hypothetical protein